MGVNLEKVSKIIIKDEKGDIVQKIENPGIVVTTYGSGKNATAIMEIHPPKKK